MAAVACLQWRIENIAGPGFAPRPCAGKQRHLVGGAIEQVLVGPENILRAIAVMDVEIHDGDAFGVIFVAGIECGDGGLIEKAESHGAVALGMMTGWSHGAKGVGRITLEDSIDGRCGGPHGTQDCFKCTGRHHRIAVEVFKIIVHRQRQDALHVIFGMGQKNILLAALRCFEDGQTLEVGRLQDLHDRLHAVDPLGMTLRCHVLQGRCMGVDQGGHLCAICTGR